MIHKPAPPNVSADEKRVCVFFYILLVMEATVAAANPAAAPTSLRRVSVVWSCTRPSPFIRQADRSELVVRSSRSFHDRAQIIRHCRGDDDARAQFSAGGGS